jgi:ribosomal protein L24
MTRKINIGNPVVVVGGQHRGKSAVVVAVTPKMFYVKFKCTGNETQVVAYNVRSYNEAIQIKETSAVPVEDGGQHVQCSGNDKVVTVCNDSHLALTAMAADTGKAELIVEIRKMTVIIEKLTAILQDFKLK